MGVCSLPLYEGKYTASFKDSLDNIVVNNIKVIKGPNVSINWIKITFYV